MNGINIKWPSTEVSLKYGAFESAKPTSGQTNSAERLRTALRPDVPDCLYLSRWTLMG
jgi:hypothetical protein